MDNLYKIKTLNELEYSIYLYLSQDKNKIRNLKLKEAAEELHVSPAMVTRVCKKLGFNGFSEYKLHLRFNESKSNHVKYDKIAYLLDYFQRAKGEKVSEVIKKIAEEIVNSDEVLFFGLSLSGALAKYGALLLNRKGIRSSFIDDISWRVEDIYDSKTLAIILTVSGDTEETNKVILNLRASGVKVVVISNSENSQSAKMADYSIGYYVPSKRDKFYFSSATQVPVIYIIEEIADEVNRIRLEINNFK